MRDGSDPTRLTVLASIVLLCAGAVVLIVMTLTGADSDGTGARALGTALTVVFFLLTATAGATLTRSRAELAWFGYVTATISIAALAGTTLAIWGHPGSGQGKPIGVAAVLALAAAHASLLLGPRYRDGGDTIRLLRNATLAMLTVLAALIVYAILSSGDGLSGKVVTIIAILYVLGSLVLPIARRSQARSSILRPLETPDGSATDLLRANGYALVDGPHPLESDAASGERVRLRGPEGRLVDLLTYEE
jgi:hypothetical protein